MVDVVKDALREQIKEHEGYRLDAVSYTHLRAHET